MIRQDDSRFSPNPNIKEYACYLFTYLWWGNKLAGYELGIGEIRGLIAAFQLKGWLKDDMTVEEPGEILQFLGIHADVRAESADYVCKRGEHELLMWAYTDADGKRWEHATAGDGEGHCTYDPLGQSHCVALGKVFEKRIIKEVAT